MARGRPSGWDVLRRERLASDAHKRELEAARQYGARPEARRKRAADMRAEREVRREHGLCLWCKADAFAPFRLCQECLEKAAHSAARYRRRQIMSASVRTAAHGKVAP